MDAKDWITAREADESIRIIDAETWNRVQEKRTRRGKRYTEKLENQDITVIQKNNGTLPLIDVIYCGYCGCMLTNGSRYNYWTIKSTGEKRASKMPIYKCQNAWQGVPHEDVYQFRAADIETPIFETIAAYIGKLQENKNVFEEIEKNHNREKSTLEKELQKLQEEADKIRKKIDVMEGNIPDAMSGEYPLSLDELVALIKKQKTALEHQESLVREKELAIQNLSVSVNDWEEIKKKIPTWQDVFLNADANAKRVLVNRLIKRIEVKKEEITIHFKVNLEEVLQPRITDGFGVQE